MSILTKTLRYVLSVTVKALINDATRNAVLYDKANKKIKEVENQYVAKRAELRKQASELQSKAISTHSEQAAKVKAIREKVTKHFNESVVCKKQAEKLKEIFVDPKAQ